MVRKKEENSSRYSQLEEGANRAKPVLHQHAREIQPFNKIARLPNALDEVVCAKSIENLNQLLADTMTLDGGGCRGDYIDSTSTPRA